MGTNSIIRDRACRRPIGVALESLSSVSTKKREFFPRGKRKERKNLVFRKWKEATTVRFFDQHLFDPRTSEADTCLWHPSSDDFVKSSGKVIQSCSGIGLCRRADC